MYKVVKKEAVLHKFAVIVLVFIFISSVVFGQSADSVPRQLGELISGGQVTLTARGNGSSSGFAVLGSLKNNTRSEIRASVIINGCIYFKNSGKGQNMLAALIFHNDGSYYFEGSRYFIILPAGGNTEVVFDAYCADFDLDNPSAGESFSFASMPSDITDIASKLSRFVTEQIDSDNDYLAAAQLALWRSRGNTREEISQKFDFEDEDWELSAEIMNR